jgi:hypothetical protein
LVKTTILNRREMDFRGLSRRDALRLALATGVAGVGTGTGDRAATVSAADADTTQVAKIAAGDGDPKDNFGLSVAMSSDGSTALIGTPDDEDPDGTTGDRFNGAGSAYVFEREGGGWRQ